MSHEYNTRCKKQDDVPSEALNTFESNITKCLNELKDEVINLKNIIMKNLQEENRSLKKKVEMLEKELKN